MRSDTEEHKESDRDREPSDSGPEQSDEKTSDAPAPDVAEQSEADPVQDALRSAEERATEAEKKAAEYLEMAQRIKADYENYRKRMLKEQTHHLEIAAQGLIESLLPALDAFDLALGTLDQIRESHPTIVKGIELVYAEMMGTLAKAGVSRIDEPGVRFDPHIHHALEHEGSRQEGDEEFVVDVLRPGYKFKRHILRPAEVKVGYRKPSA